MRVDPQCAYIPEGGGKHISRRPIDIQPGFAAVAGTGNTDGRDINVLVVIGINTDLVEGVSRLSSHIILDGIHFFPAPARIFTAIDFAADLSFLGFKTAPAVLCGFFFSRRAQVTVLDHGVDYIRILPVDIQTDSPDFSLGKAFLE